MKRIGVFGPPRSGTSWLSQIFNSHPDVAMRFQPLFSYGHKGALTPTSGEIDINNFFTSILNTRDDFALMKSSEFKNFPKFQKSADFSHIFFKETRYLNLVPNILKSSRDIKVIGIIRHPLATLASWVGAPKEFLPSWNIQMEWLTAPSKNKGLPEEYFGFSKWKKAAEMFLELQIMYPDRFRLLTYEQLNKQTEGVMSNIFEFCSLPIHSHSIKFIEDSRNHYDLDPYSVYRKKDRDDQWKSVLPLNIIDAVYEDLQCSPLEFLLKE